MYLDLIEAAKTPKKFRPEANKAQDTMLRTEYVLWSSSKWDGLARGTMILDGTLSVPLNSNSLGHNP